MSKPFDFEDEGAGSSSESTSVVAAAASVTLSPKKGVPPKQRPAAAELEVGVRGRRTGVTAKANVAKDADQLDNIDDFFSSPQKPLTSSSSSSSASSASKSSRKSLGGKPPRGSTTPKPTPAPVIEPEPMLVDLHDSESKSAPVADKVKKTPVWAKRKAAAAPAVVEDEQAESDTADPDMPSAARPAATARSSGRKAQSSQEEPTNASASKKKTAAKAKPAPVVVPAPALDVSILDIADGPSAVPIRTSPLREPKSKDISKIVQRLSFDDDGKENNTNKSKARQGASSSASSTAAASKSKPATTAAKKPVAAAKAVAKKAEAPKESRKRKKSGHNDDDDTGGDQYVEEQVEEPSKKSKAGEEDDGSRKSSRHRVAPVAFWRNEKIVYKEVAIGDDLDKTYVSTVDKVIRSKSPEVVRKPRKPAAAPASSSSSSSSSLAGKSPAKKTISTPEIKAKGFSKGVAEVSVIDPLSKTGDERKLELVQSDAPSQYSDTSFGKMVKYFETDAFSSGKFTIPKGRAKKSTNSRDNYILFVIEAGDVGVTINKTKLALSTNDTCFVPPHNHYQLENLGNKEVAMHFVYVPFVPKAEAS